MGGRGEGIGDGVENRSGEKGLRVWNRGSTGEEREKSVAERGKVREGER